MVTWWALLCPCVAGSTWPPWCCACVNVGGAGVAEWESPIDFLRETNFFTCTDSLHPCNSEFRPRNQKLSPIIPGMTPQKDPALTALLTEIENDPTNVLGETGLTVSPELERLLERGLIGNSLPPVLKNSKAAKAFQQAFDMIGGVPRLALWADQNPTKFYALYSKLVPATAEISEKKDITVTINWASPERLSYQGGPPQLPVEDATPK